MSEIELEKNINKLLERMRIDEEPENVNNIQAPGNASTASGPQTQGNIDKNLKFSYIDTDTLIHTYPPAGARTWETSNKQIYKPLKDGDIIKDLVIFLEKKSNGRWKYISELGITANKYSDYQFRILIGSKLKMDATIKFIITRDTVKAELNRLEVNTPFQAKNAVFKREGQLNRLEHLELKKIKKPQDLFRRFKGVVGYKEGSTWSDKLAMLKTAENKLDKIDGVDKSTIKIAKDLVSDILDRAHTESDPYDVDFNPKESEDLNKIISIAKKIDDMDLKPDSGAEIEEAFPLLVKNNILVKKEREQKESYSVDMSSYLKNILLEAEWTGPTKKKKKEKNPSRKTLEKDAGGELIEALDKEVIKWFNTKHGVTAYGGQSVNGKPPIFDGKLFKFFQATKVDFRAQERSIKTEEQTPEKVTVELSGYIEALGYTWLDARIREMGGWGSWTFRILDAPNKPFYHGTAKIKGPGTGLGILRKKKDLYNDQGKGGANFGYEKEEG